MIEVVIQLVHRRLRTARALGVKMTDLQTTREEDYQITNTIVQVYLGHRLAKQRILQRILIIISCILQHFGDVCLEEERRHGKWLNLTEVLSAHHLTSPGNFSGSGEVKKYFYNPYKSDSLH